MNVCGGHKTSVTPHTCATAKNMESWKIRTGHKQFQSNLPGGQWPLCNLPLAPCECKARLKVSRGQRGDVAASMRKVSHRDVNHLRSLPGHPFKLWGHGSTWLHDLCARPCVTQSKADESQRKLAFCREALSVTVLRISHT